MKLIVGLGNPGKEYDWSRHNMGYVVIDKFADMIGENISRNDFKGQYVVVKDNRFPESFILLKPLTFMNLSGESVKPLADYFHIPQEDIVVIYDEMALPVGTIRLREGGSGGGHKGIGNIIANFGSDKIARIRIGIGEPPHANAVDFVLGKPKDEERAALEESTDLAAQAVRDILLKGFVYAMNHYNAGKPRGK